MSKEFKAGDAGQAAALPSDRRVLPDPFEKFERVDPARLRPLDPGYPMRLVDTVIDVARGARLVLQILEGDDLRGDDDDREVDLISVPDRAVLRRFVIGSLDLLEGEAHRVIDWAQAHFQQPVRSDSSGEAP